LKAAEEKRKVAVKEKDVILAKLEQAILNIKRP
jgi:hypothetical protein